MRSLITFSIILLAAMTVTSQSAIRRVDFKNFTYPATCASDESENVTVEDGEYSYEKEEDGYVDRFYFKVYAPEYGDLTGDGVEEAVIIAVCNTGGTGNFTEGYVFGVRNGKPELIARFPGGDRANGGLRSAKVVNRQLVIESNDTGEWGGACCPEYIVTSKYRLSGKNLIRIGIPSRREIYPVERVTFARGTSGKTFTVTIPGDEGKRFVVGARAGQELVVSVSSDDASLMLLDDASVTHGINNFLARLTKNGDHTIQVQNNTDKPLTITVNIRIQ
ncbi:hypothetical protein [Leptolyngbya sp. 7M]|uniref:hypothetical protein n=1 Tax=Leptolyngbya sp. 7M TaxID=2812896 RepID=UPI001B8BFE93|nr:hypothetical protein [Leptolyngbya sp. 7M]QYO65934.1 hypothetical protein JVX88_03800 [Leptolyngbya sp. 7M]